MYSLTCRRPGVLASLKRYFCTGYWRRRRPINVIAVSVVLLCCLYLYSVREQKLAFLSHLKAATRAYNTSRSHSEWLNSGTSCSRPNIPLWSPDIENYLEYFDPGKCTDEKDWVYTEQGKFFISPRATEDYGDIMCRYTPYVNDEDKSKALDAIENFKNGSKLLSDVFHISCVGKYGKRFERYYPCIADNNVKKSKSENMYNVFMLGFDSLSRMMMMRLLPKTFTYFTEELQGEVLEGYNILGDGTPAALMPILTGQQETEIAETRRGKPGAVQVDEAMTFIWKKFEDKGYVTQWAEDNQKDGTFSMRLLGFKNQPVHHYMRTFYLLTEVAGKFFSKFFSNRYCYGSKSKLQLFLDWLKEGLLTNKGRPFFTFGFFSDLTHNDNNLVHPFDDVIVEFLRYMKTQGFLDHTVFVLMSDHGLRYGPLRATEQGKLEERMPFVGVYLPESFKQRFPEKTKALKVNTMRLTSPFDIHETFRDIHGEFSVNPDSFTKNRGSSLFKEISATRTCSDVGIEAHWCTCMQWEAIPVSDERTIASVDTVVSVINDLLMEYKTVCQTLSVHSIEKTGIYKSNDQMLKFKKSNDRDGRIPSLDDTLSATVVYVQVTFITSPGLGLFEATVQHDVSSGKYAVDYKDISRLNAYGDASQCITLKNPILRPYCVCK